MKQAKKYLLAVLPLLLSMMSTQVVSNEPLETKTVVKGTHQLAVALTKLGAFRCAERANQVGNYLSSNSGDIILVDMPESYQVTDMIHATLITTLNNKEFSTAEITMAPTVKGCQVSYEATIYSANSCEKSIEAHYPKQKFKNIDKTNIQIAPLGNNARVMAKPVGQGCLLVKHELVN